MTADARFAAALVLVGCSLSCSSSDPTAVLSEGPAALTARSDTVWAGAEVHPKTITIALRDSAWAFPEPGFTCTWTSRNKAIIRRNAAGRLTPQGATGSAWFAVTCTRPDSFMVTVTAATGEDQQPPAGDFSGCTGLSGTVVMVATTDELRQALAAAAKGQVITMAPGTYHGPFTLNRHVGGYALCGPVTAVLTGGFSTSATAYVNDVTFQGFQVTDAQQPFHFRASRHNRFQGLWVHHTRQEAFHFLCGSTDNVVRGTRIHDTDADGVNPQLSEAVYLGSDPTNVAQKCVGEFAQNPDTSRRNQVVDNEFGPNIPSEDVDVKPGANGTVIRGNRSNAAGKPGLAGHYDEAITVRASQVTVEGNTIRWPMSQPAGAITQGISNNPGTSGNVYGANRIHLGRQRGVAYRMSGSGHTCRSSNFASVGADTSRAAPAERRSNVPCNAP